MKEKDILPILYELGLLIKNGDQIVVNSLYQKNEIIKEQQTKKRKISQIQLEKTLEIEKKVGKLLKKLS